MRWTKLKADYIPGLGDTASFVIVGASHDAERGRQLGVGCNVFTTFYVGLLRNEWEIRQDVSTTLAGPIRPDNTVCSLQLVRTMSFSGLRPMVSAELNWNT